MTDYKAVDFGVDFGAKGDVPTMIPQRFKPQLTVAMLMGGGV